jgi:ribosome-binding protein aMBF1 (putative translation factor)
MGVLTGTLDDLAATGLASAPTLRTWFRELPQDTPWILRRGSKGDSYEIDLKAAATAFREREEAKAEEARRRATDIKQFALELGLTGDANATAGLSIAERKQLLEEELVAMKIAERRGELVPRASVEAAFADVLVRDRQRRGTFAARLAKKIDLTRAQIAQIDRLARADQDEFARTLKNWGKDLGDSIDAGVEPPDDTAAAVEAAAA